MLFCADGKDRRGTPLRLDNDKKNSDVNGTAWLDEVTSACVNDQQREWWGSIVVGRKIESGQPKSKELPITGRVLQEATKATT